MRLHNKIAVITGGGSGIGRAGVQLFAKEGAQVVVADLNGEKAEETVKIVRDAGGVAVAIQADVSSNHGNEAIVQKTLDSFGGIDIFWANAGITAPENPLGKQSVDFFDVLMAVNTKGPWLGARAAMPHLEKRPGASFIITASLSGFLARPNNTAYSASKGGAIQLMRALAIEFAPNVRVNSISPVLTLTPMVEEFFSLHENYDEVVQSKAEYIPLGRMAKAEEMASVALFLASDESSFVTGVNLPVDGGISARV